MLFECNTSAAEQFTRISFIFYMILVTDFTLDWYYFIQVRQQRTCREARASQELSTARLCDQPENGDGNRT